MAKLAVIWTETAFTQRREILKYWTIHNGSSNYSKKLIKLISERIKLILINPQSFQEANYPGTRVSALEHFSIFYKITDQYLIVTAFWDNRQNPKKLLELISGKDGH